MFGHAVVVAVSRITLVLSALDGKRLFTPLYLRTHS